MISVTLSQLTDILNGELQGADITLDAVTTDTRKLTPGCLFVALKGERFDAHDFADQAKAGGAGALLDTRLAFGELAAWVRQQVPARVVALTGSSGKTSVKEMTAAILSQCGNTLYTAGNLNNDIGVPMTLLRLTPEYDYAVIELGANHQGEIAWTAVCSPIQLAENQLLLDDSYNANVGSMTAAVQVLAEMPGYRVLVVGDMAELGAESEACHVQVGEAAKAAGIDRVLSVGKQSHAISTASGVGEHFADKTALITRLKSLIAEQQVVRNDGPESHFSKRGTPTIGRDYDPDGDCDLRTAVGLPSNPCDAAAGAVLHSAGLLRHCGYWQRGKPDRWSRRPGNYADRICRRWFCAGGVGDRQYELCQLLAYTVSATRRGTGYCLYRDSRGRTGLPVV
uniref:UDP-N-acetylmuramoyl-tripeptide--D-alanyl-D-alanine ligase n=1 Tax=Panagrolaimus superbus TaxID=310955 RepID=A0A914Y048_9BILA